MTQITLFDELPEGATPAASSVPVLYDRCNRENGHLLIASDAGDWLFENTGAGVIRCCLPGWNTAVDLTPEHLRVLGDYCHRMANRIETPPPTQ